MKADGGRGEIYYSLGFEWNSFISAGIAEGKKLFRGETKHQKDQKVLKLFKCLSKGFEAFTRFFIVR